MSDGVDVQAAGFPVSEVDDSITPDPIFPETLQVTHQGFAKCGVLGKGPNRLLDAFFYIGVKMAHDLRHVRGNVRSVGDHVRSRLFQWFTEYLFKT